MATRKTTDHIPTKGVDMIARLGACSPEHVDAMGSVLAMQLMETDHIDQGTIRVYAIEQDNVGLVLAWQALAPRSPVWPRLAVVPDGVLVVALADPEGSED